MRHRPRFLFAIGYPALCQVACRLEETDFLRWKKDLSDVVLVSAGAGDGDSVFIPAGYGHVGSDRDWKSLLFRVLWVHKIPGPAPMT